jgi:hypothetical protein
MINAQLVTMNNKYKVALEQDPVTELRQRGVPETRLKSRASIASGTVTGILAGARQARP